MASMNPNPFPVSLQKSVSVAPPVPVGIAPRPRAFVAPSNPVAPVVSAFAPPTIVSPQVVAPPTVVSPAPDAVLALAPTPSPSPSNTGTSTAWCDATGRRSLPPPAPDLSGSVKLALVKLRRAQLTRVVKAIVMASALVCVLALGRLAVAAMFSEPDTHAAAPSLRARQDLVRATVNERVDSLSERTLRAMAGVPYETNKPKHAPARATASRRHKRG